MQAAPKQLASTSLNSKAYNPYKIKIDAIEPHGQLSVDKKEDKLLLKKEAKTILEIPKQGSYSVTIHRKGRFGGLLDSRNDIELESDHPEVRLCYNTGGLCQLELTRDIDRIDVRPRDQLALKDQARAAGVLDQKVAATLSSFVLKEK